MAESGIGYESAVAPALRTGARAACLQSPALITFGMVFVDWAVLALANVIALYGRARLPFFAEAADIESQLLRSAGVISLVWLAALAVFGAYSTKPLGAGTLEYKRVNSASLIAAASVGIGAYLFHVPLSRGFYAMLFLIGPPMLLVGRFGLRRVLHATRRRGKLTCRALVAGDLDHIEDLVQVLRRERWLGYEVIGALPSNGNEAGTPSGVPAMGSPGDALSVLRRTQADAVIFTEGSFPRAHMFNRMARALEAEKAQMIVVPSLTDISAQRLHIRPVAGIPLVHVERPRAQYASRWLKRSFDLVGSSILLLLSAPVMLATALAIKLDDGGPVMFKQTRVGLKGQLFTCYKFRSMCVDAEAKLAALRAQNESQGDVLFKMAKDPRITRVGHFIRRFSIDEIPQFFNVWRGDMSLVGPRPALPSEVEHYLQHVLRRLDVRPGITGLWQVSGRSNLSWDDTVRLDLYYVDNWSMLQDVSIILKTLGAVLGSRGAY